jgi:hypothetical protein
MGGTGSGKTTALTTLMECGLELFVLSTEPTGLESLIDAVRRKKLDMGFLHYRQVTPARPSISALTDMAKKVSISDFEDLSKQKAPIGTLNERTKAQWFDVLRNLNDFHDERTDNHYGDVTTWGTERALAIDSLSGLNLMAMDLVLGPKVTAHQGEWGVAMQLIEKLILSLTSSLRCTFVITSHVERETDEVTNSQRIMASTLGRKLAPRLPRFFSEVVMCKREGTDFTWSTAEHGVDTKNRSLPVASKMAPTFKPIIEAYRERLKATEPVT